MDWHRLVRQHYFGVVACLLLCSNLLLCVATYGQLVGATLSGTVTDSSGAVVARAQIVVKDVATGVTRDTASDSAGFYTTPNLVPGTYEITASAAGFTTQLRPGIILTVGAQQVLNIIMQVGAVTQQVEVTAAAPTVELSSSALSNEVDSTTVRELPLNGRDWTQLATLQPGVTSLASVQLPVSRGSGRLNHGFGTQLAISGGRPEQNNYRMDGISMLDDTNNVPGDAFGASLGVDAIQEFSVVTSNYSAEYGRTSGGVVNAITRSGTNELHGNAYEFIRNSALDARNYFDGATVPEFRRNQFGASAGAPIKKDKTFIFGDYEGLRQSLGTTAQATVPSPDARNGIIHNTNGTTTTLNVSPQVKPSLAIFALPNQGLVGAGNTGLYSFIARQVASENYASTRVDHRISSKDSLFGAYQYDSALVTLPDVLNVVQTGQHTGNQHAAIEETHIFSPRWINTARFGYNRVGDNAGGGIAAINPAAADLSLGAIPGEDIGLLTISGLTTVNAGLNDQKYIVLGWNSFQFYDDVNVTFGRHSLKFGGNVERDQDNTQRSGNAGGSWSFGSINAFLLNQPTFFRANLQPFTIQHFRQTILGAYVQDDIRWRRNLTFNLGLRYEMSRVPTETNNKVGTLVNVTDPTQRLGSPLFNNPTLRNFEPRVGFAWDPFGDGRTSIRSGFGMFDVLPLMYQLNITQANIFPYNISGQTTSLPIGSYPTGALKLLQAIPLQQADYVDPHAKRNYVMNWNLSIQRELVGGLTLTAAYVGSHGVHNITQMIDVNMVQPTLTSSGYLWPKSSANAPVLNPNWARIEGHLWNGSSSYNAFEAQVVKQLNHGLQIQGSYTWSNSMDLSSGSGTGDQQANGNANPFLFELPFFRSLSDFSVKENVVINGMWTAPKPNLNNRVADWALGGWQLGGIFQARTGLPFFVVIGGDPLGQKNSMAYDFPNRTLGGACASGVNPGNIHYINVSCFTLPTPNAAIASQCTAFSTVPGTCQNLQGNSRRNSLIGPGLRDLDFSLFKNNYLGNSERFNAQFRMEFFNILNHTNFNLPLDNATMFNADGSPTGGAGLIDSTATTSRQIQFALKLIW